MSAVVQRRLIMIPRRRYLGIMVGAFTVGMVIGAAAVCAAIAYAAYRAGFMS